MASPTFEFWLYPGVYVDVQGLTRITFSPAAPGEVPPAGATVIPPQPPTTPAPLSHVIQQGLAANLKVAQQGVEAAQALSQQQTADAQAAYEAAIAKTNEEALKLAQSPQGAVIPHAGVAPGPPWSVTFTEKR